MYYVETRSSINKSQYVFIMIPGSLELYDCNTCYTTDDGRQVMAKANPSPNPKESEPTRLCSVSLMPRA